MRVTKAEEYAVRLAMSLAVGDGQLTIRDLAEREDLAEPTVAKVLGRLAKAGLVTATRGCHGGYTLARQAEEISLAEIVSGLGEPLQEGAFCEQGRSLTERCARANQCGLRPVWTSLAAVIGDFLSNITVADLITGNGSKSRIPSKGR